MTWLALWLLGLGLADLAGVLGWRRPWPLVVGLAAPWALGLALLPWTPPTLAGLAAGSAALGWWRWRHAQPPGSRRPALWGLTAIGVPALAGIAASGLAPAVAGPAAEWLRHLPLFGAARIGPEKTLLLAALFVANVETANLLVRDVLTASGVMPLRRPTGAQGQLLAPRRLRGGRVLGAMERLLILGFGAGGNLTAAGLVIAAKGLIRFPELTAASKGDGDGVRIDEVTEYFLIGSFASILVALASVALAS